MLAGILQIRSPSGANGWYIPKINPDIKKAACISTSCLVKMAVFNYLLGPVSIWFHTVDSDADVLILSILGVLTAKDLNIKRFGKNLPELC